MMINRNTFHVHSQASVYYKTFNGENDESRSGIFSAVFCLDGPDSLF